jgi:hypothetical protein
MSIQLKIIYKEGLRVRQQSAHKAERVGAENILVSGTEWRFDPTDVEQDKDQRRVDRDGKPEKLGTFTVHIVAGLKNMVLEKKGKSEHVEFRNGALRNQMRIKMQELVEVRKAKDGKTPVMEWKENGPVQYVPPNSWTGVAVGDGLRAIVEELPT